eukprot:9769973-Lingulodinium_polyedra.AAC.1
MCIRDRSVRGPGSCAPARGLPHHPCHSGPSALRGASAGGPVLALRPATPESPSSLPYALGTRPGGKAQALNPA